MGCCVSIVFVTPLALASAGPGGAREPSCQGQRGRHAPAELKTSASLWERAQQVAGEMMREGRSPLPQVGLVKLFLSECGLVVLFCVLVFIEKHGPLGSMPPGFLPFLRSCDILCEVTPAAVTYGVALLQSLLAVAPLQSSQNLGPHFCVTWQFF